MMFVLSKIFTYLFLPPGIFIIILLIAGFMAKRLKWIFFTASLFLYLISIKPVSNLLLHPLESFVYQDNIIPKAVVVLGGGVNPKDPLHANSEAFKREIYGLLLSKKHNLPFVFTGGGIDKEAEFVKKDIEKITDICECDIKSYYESLSADTYQNAKFTSLLFEKNHLQKEIYLVTSAYHMKRATILFKHFGFKLISKPVGFYTKPINSVWDFFPNEGNFHHSYKAIHEYFGLLSLKLRGL